MKQTHLLLVVCVAIGSSRALASSPAAGKPVALVSTVSQEAGMQDAPAFRAERPAPRVERGAYGWAGLWPSTGGRASSGSTDFDFETGSAPIDVVIPSILPVLFQAVAPGDAPLVLRTTTLVTNSWFDAIAPYGATSVGVYSQLGRRPVEEATDANRNVAILHASYHVLQSLYPTFDADWRAMLERVGLDPDDLSSDPTTAVGIGNLAGTGVVAARSGDGMNQLGRRPAPQSSGESSYHPKPYGDYTGYEPVNTAYELSDPSRWQPKMQTTGFGIFQIQHFVTPQYARTLPYSYESPQAFSVPRPVASQVHNIALYKGQADQVLAASAALTDEQKMIAELFEDKIRGLGFSALFASQVNGLSLEDFVHFDFLTNVAAFDTGIVIWQEKTRYDAVRPFSAIRHLYGNDLVTAWGGPGQGTVTDLPASDWESYLPVANHPEYPSASASFCAAHAQASRRFFGTDDLGWSLPVPQGSSVIEPGITPADDIVLHWDTWTEFEKDCGDSRFWAGVHFPASIPAGQDVGHEIADIAFGFVMAHIEGRR